MSKGGSTSSTVEVPEYIEKAAQRNLNQADLISKLDFIPEYGPTVAAFTPVQEAAFQSTAQAAGAFGLPGGGMSQQDIMGGMPEPTTYAGGVRGYSSLPIYEQALEAFGEARPGQKRYRDSFFIDPVTGVPGSNMQAPVDYTVAPTPGDLGGISAGGGGDAPYIPPVVSTVVPSSALSGAEIKEYSQVIADGLGIESFDPYKTAEVQMTPEVYDVYRSQPISDPVQLAAGDIYTSNLGNANSNIIDAGKGLLNIDPSFKSPSSSGSYGGSLVTGGLSGNLTGIPGIFGNIADSVLSSVAPEYAMELQGQNFAASGGSTYDPNMSIENKISGQTSTGGYKFDPKAFSSDYLTGEIPVGVSPATPIPTYDAFSVAALDMPDTSMTAIPGYTTPLPTTFEGPIATGTTLPTGSTIVNDYSDPATLAKYEADRAPGGIFYESSGSQRAEEAQRELIQSKDDTLAQSVDTSELAGLAKNKNTAKQWLNDNGYGNYDKDDAIDVLKSKIADINKSQLQQGLKDGIIYTDDRREVYVDGVLVGNPKSADTAQEMLDRELKKKAEAAPAPSAPSAPLAPAAPSPAPSAPSAPLAPSAPSAPSAPAPAPSAPAPAPSADDSGVSGSTGTEVRSLSNGTEYFVDSNGQFAGLKKDGPPQFTSAGMEVRSLSNGTEYFVDSNGQFAGLK